MSDSLDTVLWMRDLGVRFLPIYGRQAFQVDGKHTFWGGLTVEVSGGGRGLVEALHRAAGKAGIKVMYGARATDLVVEGSRVTGVRILHEGCDKTVSAGAVVLAAGGFHANAEWRARYLGKDWDLAKVRGSRFNTGDGIGMAIRAGAMPYGHWSGCHAVAYDVAGIEPGDLDVLGQQKNSFPFGVIVNAQGRRFFDEGADFRNYTYSKLGHAVLEQPGRVAWQVFDAQVAHLLTDEYRIRQITRVQADTLEGLAQAMEGVDPQGFLAEIEQYNAAVAVDIPFNPAVKDGRAASGLATPKSNWANRIEKPPFTAYGVTCGITFTYASAACRALPEFLLLLGRCGRNILRGGGQRHGGQQQSQQGRPGVAQRWESQCHRQSLDAAKPSCKAARRGRAGILRGRDLEGRSGLRRGTGLGSARLNLGAP